MLSVEDYDRARALKMANEEMQSLHAQVDEAEDAKDACVKDEDYDGCATRPPTVPPCSHSSTGRRACISRGGAAGRSL